MTTYDQEVDGRPISVVHPGGQEVALDYDYEGVGLLTRIESRPAPGALADGSVDFEYNAAQRLTAAVKAGGPLLSTGIARPQVRRTFTWAGPLATGQSEVVDWNGTLQSMLVNVSHDEATWLPDQLTVSDAFNTTHGMALAFDDDGLATGIGDLVLVNDGQGVGLPTTLTLGDLVVDQTFTRFGELETRTLRHSQTRCSRSPSPATPWVALTPASSAAAPAPPGATPTTPSMIPTSAHPTAPRGA